MLTDEQVRAVRDSPFTGPKQFAIDDTLLGATVSDVAAALLKARGALRVVTGFGDISCFVSMEDGEIDNPDGTLRHLARRIMMAQRNARACLPEHQEPARD